MFFFKLETNFFLLINKNGSGRINVRLWSNFRSISIYFGENRKISSKSCCALCICILCLRSIFGLLIFEIFDENGMGRKYRKCCSRNLRKYLLPEHSKCMRNGDENMEFFSIIELALYFSSWIGGLKKLLGYESSWECTLPHRHF